MIREVAENYVYIYKYKQTHTHTYIHSINSISLKSLNTNLLYVYGTVFIV